MNHEADRTLLHSYSKMSNWQSQSKHSDRLSEK